MTSNYNFKQTILATALSSTFLLAGCGGSDGTTIGEQSGTDGSIEGVVAKGIIKNGLVSAIELKPNGDALRELGSTSTNDQGEYSLPLTDAYTGGPVKVTVEAQEGTEMLCDIHSDEDGACEFGSTVDLESGFSMDAIIGEAKAGEDLSLPVTLLTHMAAQRVLNSTQSIGKELVDEANAEVGQIVGLDILSVKPIDITDSAAATSASPDEKTYAAFIAGLGRIALENGSGLNAGVEAVGASFADGKLSTGDAVTATKLIEAVSEESSESELGAAAAIASIEARLNEDGSFDPVTPTQAATDLEKGKELVSDVRTWLTSLADYENPLNAFAGDVELASEMLNSDVENHLELYSMILDEVVEALDAKATNDPESLIGTHSIPVLSEDDMATTLEVTVAKTGVDNGLEVSIPETPLTESDISVAVNVSTNLPEEALDEEAFSLSKLDLDVDGSITSPKTSISLDQVHVVAHSKAEFEVNGEVDPEPTAKSATYDGDFTIMQQVDDDSGSVDYTFTGKTHLELVELTKNNAEFDISLKTISIDGKISTSDSRELSAKIELDISNAANFNTLGYIDHNSGIHSWNESNEDVFNIWDNLQVPSGMTQIQHIKFTSMPDETCHFGHSGTEEDIWEEVCNLGDTYNLKAAVTTQLQSQYPNMESIDDIYVFTPNEIGNDVPDKTHYSANINFEDFETAANYLNATLTAETALALNGLPDAKLVATAERQELEKGVVSAAFIQSNIERFKLNVTADGEVGTGEAVFKNSSGAALTLKPDAEFEIGSIVVNGTTVGSLEERDGKYVIVWSDNTIETLQ